MLLSSLNHRSVCILGFGREGQATLRAIEREAPGAEVTVADARDIKNQESLDGARDRSRIKNQESFGYDRYNSRTRYQCGKSYLHGLDRFDVIIISPGIMPRRELDAVTAKITNATQIFLEEAKERGAFVIGVTGSKGKSTTTSLLHAILKQAGKDAHLVGNIGVPSLGRLPFAKPGAIFVCEMSSYQLMRLAVSPPVALVTSVFPEHLDYHGSFEAYKEAKKGIARFQKKDDVIFFDESSDGSQEIANASPGRQIGVASSESPVVLKETKLIGEHNLRNIALASCAAKYLGIAHKDIVAAIKNFEGLPHRLQSLGVHHGILWIDDAISTTPESTIAALDALGAHVATIILGGHDRGNDFMALAERIQHSFIATVILFPGSGSRIKEALKKASVKAEMFDARNMKEAVALAKKHTVISHLSSAICLLSTASPSYGMFKNFEEKGEEFRKAIFS